MTRSTLRISLPQWQGGMNHNYQFGNQILNAIVPPSIETPTLQIPLAGGDETTSKTVDGEGALLAQMQHVRAVLAKREPSRVITLGGDCSVSEAPFDYLHGQYPEHFGVIWLDAHPDISTPEQSHHLHEMVVADLLHLGAPMFNSAVEHPIEPTAVFFAGLQHQALRPMDGLVDELGMAYATSDQLTSSSQPLLAWLKEHQIEHVAVHWDLDVIDPDEFRSILPAQPQLDRSQFGAAIGAMTLQQVTRLLQDVSEATDLVGLTLAEHMPWDAINLRQALSQIPIFA